MFTLQPPATPHFSQCQCERNADMVMGMVLVSFIHNPDMSKKKKIQHIDYVSRGKICEILLETKPDSYLFYV